MRTLRLLITISLLLSSILPQQIMAQADSPTATSQQTSELANDDQSASSEYFLREQQFLDERIEQYLAQMSIADKVGQLFVVSFQGKDLDLESDIAELIYLYRIGGVSISPAYSNFNNDKNNAISTPKQVAILVNLLQSLAYGVSLGRAVALEPSVVKELGGQEWPAGVLRSRAIEEGFDNVNPSNLPLFIAIEQDGNGVPGTSLIHDFTQLPSHMAIGSTWETRLAEQVGQIVGRELNAVGINMLLGPNLNVFTQPSTEQVGRLGIRSFGRSPFWVSKMSRAYIQGVHNGANQQVITIARNFPGQGSSDRLPDQEIATIQKTLEELEQIHIAPFVSVTRNDSSIISPTGDLSMTDGLMSSHMRYGSLQGGPNAKPLSLVPQLSELLENEQFSTWRQNGLVMSDELGSMAIRRFYDPSMSELPILDVALSAFDAGHDLLYLSRFGLGDTWEAEKINIIKTITYFQQLYAENPDFAEQVDESVRRILRVKMRMYTSSPTELMQAQLNAITEAGTIDSAGATTETTVITATLAITGTEIDSVETITDTVLISDTEQIDLVNSYSISLTQAIALSDVLAVSTDLEILEGQFRDEANAIVGQVAQSSFTLLYPSNIEQVPQPPKRGDNVLIITDSRLVKECESCIAQVLGPDTLKNKIIELYGSEGRALVDESQFTAIGFSDLAEYLDKRAEAITASSEENDDVDGSTETPEAESTVQTATDGDNTENAASIDSETEVLRRMEERFEESNWIIFVMLDIVEEVPSSTVVKRFLGANGERLRAGDKTIAVLALNAPYFLDATEVSQLSAYFGVNSGTDPFIENAVNGLFQAYTPRGTPVYDVPGTIYANLSERLKPDPDKVIPLQLFIDELLIAQVPVADEEELPVDSITIQTGQSIRLQVGPIFDRNGHIVPDGTIVEFQALDDAGEPELSSDPVTTRNGIATRIAQFVNGGRLLISAISDPATSAPLELFVEATDESEVAVDPSPSADAASINEATTTITVSITPITEELAPPTPTSMLPVRSPNAYTLAVAVLTIIVMISMLLILQIKVLPRQYLVQNMLWAMIVGLFAYIMYSAYLLYTGIEMSLQASLFGTAIVVFISMLLPLLWLQLREQ